MTRRYEQDDSGKLRPPSRFSHGSTPNQAQQARHDEGQRWIHMDADDATWARTPEEQAWRNLNADARAEQVAAPAAEDSKPFQLSDLFTFQAAPQPSTPDQPFSHPENAGQIGYEQRYEYRHDPYFYQHYTQVFDTHLHDDFYYHDEYYDYDDFNRHQYYPAEFYRSYETAPYYPPPAYDPTPSLGSYPSSYGDYYYQSPTQPYETASAAAASVIAAGYIAPDARDTLSQAAIDYTPQAWDSAASAAVYANEAPQFWEPPPAAETSAVYSSVPPNVSEAFERRADYLHNTVSGVIEQTATPYASFIDSERSMDAVAQQSAWTSDMAALSSVEAIYSPLHHTPDLENRLTVNQIGNVHSRSVVNQALSPDESTLLGSYAHAYSHSAQSSAVAQTPAGASTAHPIGYEKLQAAETYRAAQVPPLHEHAGVSLPHVQRYERANRLTVNQADDAHNRLTVNQLVSDEPFAPVTAVGTAEQTLAREHPFSIGFQPDGRLIANQIIEEHNQQELLLGQESLFTQDARLPVTSQALAGASTAHPIGYEKLQAAETYRAAQVPLLHEHASAGLSHMQNQGQPNRLTVNQADGAQSRLTVNQVEKLQAQVTLNRDMRRWMSEAQQTQGAPGFAPSSATNASARAAAATQMLTTSPTKHQQAENLVLAEESMVKKQGAAEQVAGAPSVEALLKDAASPKDAISNTAKPSAQSKAERGAADLKAASLGLADMAGGAVVAGAKGVVGLAGVIFDRALREDEDLVKVADAAEVARDATSYAGKRAPSKPGSAEDKLLSAVAAQDLIRQGQLDDSALKARKIDVRAKGVDAADAEELAVNVKAVQMLDEKPDVLEKSPAGLRGKAIEAGEAKGAEQFILSKQSAPDEAGIEGECKKKSLKNRFEKKLADKRKERLAKLNAKDHGKALDAVKGQAAKSTLLVEGAVLSGAKKVLTKENEELAVAVSMVEKARKVKSAAKVPVKIYRHAKNIIQTVVTALKGIGRTIVAIGSSGPAGAIIILIVFMLLVLLVAALIGTASIINDEQEISEVSALVAQLDEELTEEIRETGSQGIYYCNARDTYGEKNGSKNLTKNVDLADGKSDLKEVAASTVTVQTDPGEIVAYIDAKYTGNWQVGAASWKYTVDFGGKKWNIIEWEDMPEWCWKALNKLGKLGFYDKVAEELWGILTEDYGVSDEEAVEISNGIADEFANVVFDQQVQAINEAVINQVIEDGIDKHAKDLKLSKKEKKKLYYQMSEVVARLIGEEEPFAFVYDEIVTLHERMNWWSEKYDGFEDKDADTGGGGVSRPRTGTGSGTDNKYGYPNSSGYDEKELEKWDGYNEVSLYGVSESGTTGTLADGTKITNTWADTTMSIACEGLQNKIFAYWTSDYKAATKISDPKPVKITMYNPSTGKTTTAEIRDCGGWRGFNKSYSGMNADRQWDLLPAVWKSLGGTRASGLLKVYWKVDPSATVGDGAAYTPKKFKDYPWPKESDNGKDSITLNRPTLVVHSIGDALNNGGLMDEIIGKGEFATEDEYKSIKNFIVTKVRGVMRSFLTMKNENGDEYTDYLYFRRSLASPFGNEKNGDARQWTIEKRYNPSYDKFDLDKAEVEIKPLGDVENVYTIQEGEVRKIKDGKVTVRTDIDTANSAEVTYAKLKGVAVEKGDKVKAGQYIGKMDGKTVKIAYYEVNDATLQIETKKDWAYDPGMFMLGFGGYKQPDAPEAYTGGGGKSDYSKCKSVVEFARSRLGCPYVWGATGPDEFDCSGLTQWCYAHAGITIPRNSEEQHDAAAAKGNCHAIDLSKMQPGDIVWKSGHVGIYIGDDQYIHAPQTGDVVKISKNVKALFTHYLRFG